MTGRSRQARAIGARSALRRNGRIARLGLRLGLGHASTSARKVFASAQRRESLSRDRELRTARQVATELGQMKGALMKLGQMASYLDDGLPEPLRHALVQLQSQAPPMSVDLARAEIERELGAPIHELFAAFDDEPIAAASIGQVHRAIARMPDGTERAVAVKVQYPGVAEAIDADLRTADLLGALLALGFKSLNPDEMVAEIKERLIEELDYRREAENQRLFGEFFRGHPFVHVPDVLDRLSTARVLTTELVTGSTFDEVTGWSQDERDMAGETIFRFVFRSLYRFRAFNGDPHPGNYLFHGGGRVTFLDFGLVKHFTEDEMSMFKDMVSAALLEHDMEKYRRIIEGAGMLAPDAPVTTEEAGDYFARFYEPVRESRPLTWTTGYATSIVRHTFDRTSAIAQYATVPRSFVFIQRINLGLYAILGRLGCTGNYRRISEELWPMVGAPPSTPMGEAEARWLAARAAGEVV
ncbi:MAG: AarF/ABC1/UbiB kinase family protein [Actinobacteria bacterium]|nr:AarF/ABC1/UbiB kinase family protein [Actinomycetota bacterium]